MGPNIRHNYLARLRAKHSANLGILEIADSDGVFAANTYISVKKDTGRIAPTDVFNASIEFDGF